MFKHLLKAFGAACFTAALFYWKLWQDIPNSKKETLASVLDFLPVMLASFILAYVFFSVTALSLIVVKSLFFNSDAASVQSNSMKLTGAPLLSSKLGKKETNHV